MLRPRDDKLVGRLTDWMLRLREDRLFERLGDRMVRLGGDKLVLRLGNGMLILEEGKLVGRLAEATPTGIKLVDGMLIVAIVWVKAGPIVGEKLMVGRTVDRGTAADRAVEEWLLDGAPADANVVIITNISSSRSEIALSG